MISYVQICFILLMLGLSGCTNVGSEKIDKHGGDGKKKHTWYCSEKRGFAGSYPNISVVSSATLNEKNQFCISLIQEVVKSVKNDRLQQINLLDIFSPYHLATEIKNHTEINPTIQEIVDYDGIHKTRLSIPVNNSKDIFARIDFIREEKVSLYKRKGCLYELESTFRSLGEFNILSCNGRKKYNVRGKLVARRLNSK